MMARRHRIPGERPLYWAGSSKEDLLAFPGRVRDAIGAALSVAIRWKTPQREAVERRGTGNPGDCGGPSWRYFSRGIHGPLHTSCLRPARFPEEVSARDCDFAKRHRTSGKTSPGRARRLRGYIW